MHSEAEMAAARIKARAAELGFDACGLAEAGNVDPEGRLRDWIARGYHAGMDWLARTADIRADVRLKMPEARSVVVVARNYYTKNPRFEQETTNLEDAIPPFTPQAGNFDARYPRPDTSHPKPLLPISRFARGRDYHRVLLKPLRALAETIRAMGAAELPPPYVCIDSGPVLERAYAARAGIGWIGKNSLVLREDLGSWFFLGVIVSAVELAPGQPVPNRCGACTRCIEACPTGAIVAPGVVDARRCISYHTIENRGEIPEDIRQRMGGRIFGCDTCQEACPWNRHTPETTERDFLPRPGLINPSMEEWRSMDEAAFDRLTAGTPAHRAKFAGVRSSIKRDR